MTLIQNGNGETNNNNQKNMKDTFSWYLHKGRNENYIKRLLPKCGQLLIMAEHLKMVSAPT